MKLYRWFVSLSALVFFLLVLGGTVRNLGAGLSCPDWPLCFGHIIPPFDVKIFSEYFHRLVAATVSLVFLGLFCAVMFNKKYRKRLGPLMGLALVLLISQVILGGLTVLKLLKYEIVTMHLTTGTLFFASILLMTFKQKKFVQDHNPAMGSTRSSVKTAAHAKKSSPPMPRAAISSGGSNPFHFHFGFVALAALFLQIILGGMVSSNGAGLACPDFPKCLGEWWPGFHGVAGIHFAHRLGATAVFIIILSYVILLFSKTKENKAPSKARSPTSGQSLRGRLQWQAAGIAFLLLTQIGLGISNVVFHLPVVVSVAHLAVAEALFTLLLMSTYEVGYL